MILLEIQRLIFVVTLLFCAAIKTISLIVESKLKFFLRQYFSQEKIAVLVYFKVDSFPL